MDAPFAFGSNQESNELFNFEDFHEHGSDSWGAELNPELDAGSALASPFVPPCTQGGEEVARFTSVKVNTLGTSALGDTTGFVPSASPETYVYDNSHMQGCGHASNSMTYPFRDSTNQKSNSRSSNAATSLIAFSESTASDDASGSANLGTLASNIIEHCTCPTCTAGRIDRFLWGTLPCVFNCGTKTKCYRTDFVHHYRTHFKNEQDQYCCQAPDCNTAVTRWGELTRHYRTHCLKPQIFPYEVIGCKYGGANGFKRKDKLLSHKRNVHDGRAAPDQLLRKRKLAPKE